jgi:N utilization substance protein A
MNSDDLLRMIDVIHRDKDIPKEVIFLGLEEALAIGVRKRLGAGEDLVVTIDRPSGEITVEDEEEEYEIDMAELGRIAAQAIKQGFLQKLREAERDVLFDEYEGRVGALVNGTVQRFDGDELVINLGRVEAYLPKDERVRGETFAPGDRIRAIVIEVRKDGPRVRIVVSRAHADLVRRLFELEVPEIADGIIEIKRVVREPGYRTKMGVISQDPKIDCIGACVGVRGSRIKAVIDELRGERIDIIRWSDSLETLIMNGLKPATIHLDNIFPDVDSHSAVVLVDEDQQSLAIGKKGQNVRLASRLCGWDIDIKTRAEFEADSLGDGGGEGEDGEGLGDEGQDAAALPADASNDLSHDDTTQPEAPASGEAEASAAESTPESNGGDASEEARTEEIASSVPGETPADR